jgi:CubicO group peptidase (beta-lactamase class C family)
MGTHASPVSTVPQALAPLALPVAGASEVPPSGQHELTQADADAWLDGLMPSALAWGDIAGAVVVIVKDGQVLTQRGFGYADIAARKRVDPATTLFRVGSTSKLFTWTAVMQLVEKGKIDLDVDVNRYLDFRVPPYRDKPITMRNIMTHTSGFEEAVKGGITFSGKVDPLGDVVKRMLPKRVFPPGTTPAYSNYATALAGYIVERVSGMSFDTYIEREIFQPLGMNRSTFRQPLPASLAPFMAKGYPKASVDPKPFELISVPPAGSLSMSGADAAKFMIAQLNRGAGLMKPATAQLMQTPAYGAIPGLNRMALGFYEQRINDLEVIAHGGDLNFFHGYMWLFPQKNVGLLVEMNSAGEGAAPYVIRQILFEQFSDRYFPATDLRPPVELGTAKEHARMLVGSYVSSRGAFTNFVDVENLVSQVKIGLDEEGRPLVPELFGGPPRKWIEVAPFLWQDAFGHARLGATVEKGRVVRWSIDEVSPFMVYDRVPWHRDATWLMPSFLAAIVTVLIAAVAWPIGALTRRYYGAPVARAGIALKSHRHVLIFAWLVAAVIGGWILVFRELIESMSTLDWPIWLLQIIGTLAFFGLFATTLRNLKLTWKDGRGWFAKLWAVLLVCAASIILWVALSFHLVSFGTKY